MKIAYAAALSLVLVPPALAGPMKTVNQVTFTCEVTGGDKDGFSIIARNDGPTDKRCSASCTLTTAGNSTKKWTYGTITVKAGPAKIYFGGEAGQPGKPFTNPDLTEASCS